MRKKIMSNFETINPQEFYKSLDKKERSQFIRFLVLNYDMCYQTAVHKMNGHKGYILSKIELEVLHNIIKNQLWREQSSELAQMDTSTTQ